MRTSASPMRFATLAMPQLERPARRDVDDPGRAALGQAGGVLGEVVCCAHAPQWVEGGGVGGRLERPLDAADGENAVDRLRAQPSQVYDRKCWA